MSGFDLIEEIKKDPQLGDIPIIAYISRNLSKKDEAHLKRLGQTMNLKEVRSPERLLDETALFLHCDMSMLPEAKRAAIQKLHETETVLKDKKILIVDDDIRNIFAMTSLLERYEMQILSAETGKTALEQLQASPDIDVVLMDIMMPDMDGYDTMRAIRKFAQIPHAAGHRSHGQGHERRPGKVHRCRRFGLHCQAGGQRRIALHAAPLALSVNLMTAAERIHPTPAEADELGREPAALESRRCWPPDEDRANILLVDDREDKRLAMETIIADLGQNIVKATSGKEALRCLLHQDFAVILLDVNMPGMDGFETAHLIRQRKSSEHTPDHFCHRHQRHRDPRFARIFPGRGGLHPHAGVAGGVADQGFGVRRVVQKEPSN